MCLPAESTVKKAASAEVVEDTMAAQAERLDFSNGENTSVPELAMTTLNRRSILLREVFISARMFEHHFIERYMSALVTCGKRQTSASVDRWTI